MMLPPWCHLCRVCPVCREKAEWAEANRFDWRMALLVAMYLLLAVVSGTAVALLARAAP